ncbi:MAG: hypothetical protein KatS3mg042_1665 [Rhodothermaceae bacterium]|nr:MAG: hypothetical protein KatS3mg042_1665 [Rhodothermaceae bacterium]
MNDIWGWTDPASGREFAIVGRTDGTAFVEVTDPVNPVYLGSLPLHAGAQPSIWRDMKVYANHAFIVADGAGAHGLQVFDLTRLLNVATPPVTFTEDAHYDAFGSAHNIVINEDTGFAYAVGLSSGGTTCGGGFHAIDIRDPLQPTFAGCFADYNTRRGYTHDAQCVVYHGPDAEHQGKELCFGSNEDKVSIIDMTDKALPRVIANASYPNAAYTHQGWLTEDHRYLIVDDELDELQGRTGGTRTLIWDVTDLDDPQLVSEYLAPRASIDHNQYVKGHYVFQAHYTSGLRILDIADLDVPREVAFFDTYTPGDGTSFQGAWSVYPYFPSGTIVVSSIGEGLFVLRSPLVATGREALAEVPDTHVLAEVYPNPFDGVITVTMQVADTQAVEVALFDAAGRRVATLHEGRLASGLSHRFTFDGRTLAAGTYYVRIRGEHFTETRTLSRVR